MSNWKGYLGLTLYLSHNYNAVLRSLPRQFNIHSHLGSPSPSNPHEGQLSQRPTSGPRWSPNLGFSTVQCIAFQFKYLFVFFSAFPWGLRDVVAFYPPEGLRGLLGPNPVVLMGEGQGTSWMSQQLIAGPLLMTVAAPQGVSNSGVQYLAQGYLACSSVPPKGNQEFEQATFWSLVHQLYPLSYSRPSV